MNPAITTSQPSSPTTAELCDRGRALVEAGALAPARRVFQLACLREPLEPAPWIGLGLCQQRLGEAEAATVAYGLARALGADHPGLLVQEAECRIRAGHGDSAVPLLETAIEAADAAGDATLGARARATLAWLVSNHPGTATAARAARRTE